MSSCLTRTKVQSLSSQLLRTGNPINNIILDYYSRSDEKKSKNAEILFIKDNFLKIMKVNNSLSPHVKKPRSKFKHHS